MVKKSADAQSRKDGLLPVKVVMELVSEELHREASRDREDAVRTLAIRRRPVMAQMTAIWVQIAMKKARKGRKAAIGRP